ncbi:MAG: TonB-dependent receptor plug domain-containing protein, partial [Flavisolibacter sp.]
MSTIKIAAGSGIARRLVMVLFLFLASLFIWAQEKTITGTVRDAADGRVIDKATVQVKGTSQMVVTSNLGVFSIRANAGQVLVVSAIGYTTMEKTVGTQAVINFDLAASDAQMEGVVVTALGIKREEKALGYSTTTIKGEQLTEAVSANWTDALSGKVAGLNLVRSNSGPAGSNKIILRGENNLTGDNEALIVVDGVVINQGSGRRNSIGGEAVYGTSSDNMPADYGSGLNDINPEDIESVTVLKGPGAAALYGQRGANGAIIITTKSGSSKRKGWGVTVNSNASMEKVNRWPDMQYEYGQGLDGNPYYSFGAGPDGPSTSATSSAYGPRFEGQMFHQFDPVTQAQGVERTLWRPYPNQTREYFNTAQTLTNSVSIDGGTDKTTARFSITNVSNKWIVPNTGYKRNTISMSVNSKVNDRLQINSKINYTNRSSDNLPGAGYGNQSIMYWYIFWQPSADMNWLKNYWINGLEGRKISYPFSTFPENPYAVAYEFINSTRRNTITGNIQATYNFNKDLSLQVRTTMDLAYEQRAQERPFDAGSKFQKGSYRTQNIFSQEMGADFLLRYATKFNNDIEFSASFGGSTLINHYNRDETRADSLIYPGIYAMSNAAGPLVSMPWKSQYNINSFYGLLSAGYKNFLYVDLTARQDWNSVLATPTRTENAGFFYPSAN